MRYAAVDMVGLSFGWIAGGGVLSIEKISRLFADEIYRKNLAEIIDNCGIVKSYRVTPAMRMVAKNAINIPLIGPLKRLYL